MRHETPREETGPQHPESPEQPAPDRDSTDRDSGPETTADVTAEPDDPDPYARSFAIDELTGPADED